METHEAPPAEIEATMHCTVDKVVDFFVEVMLDKALLESDHWPSDQLGALRRLIIDTIDEIREDFSGSCDLSLEVAPLFACVARVNKIVVGFDLFHRNGDYMWSVVRKGFDDPRIHQELISESSVFFDGDGLGRDLYAISSTHPRS